MERQDNSRVFGLSKEMPDKPLTNSGKPGGGALGVGGDRNEEAYTDGEVSAAK